MRAKRASLAAIVLSGLLIAPAAAEGATTASLGRSAELFVRGDSTDDFIRISRTANALVVQNSRDEVEAGRGCESAGRSKVRCGTTRRTVVNAGGGNGDDHVSLQNQDIGYGNYVFGMSGDDVLLGGSNVDNMIGGGGADHINGADGGDYIDGEEGADSMFGGKGNDKITATLLGVHAGKDPDREINCGSGRDSYTLDEEDPEPVSCEDSGF